MKFLFNDGWEFAKISWESDFNNLNFPNADFEHVSIPHDWLIYDSKNLYEKNIGIYRKNFSIDSMEKKYFINFDGVYMDTTVYVNKKEVGQWKYGYSAFEFDISDFLIEGKNEIIVKVCYISPNSRWYSGAGIYRNIFLKILNENYIKNNGIYISTEKIQDNWNVIVETELNNNSLCVVKHSIIFQDEIIKSEEETIAELNSTFKKSISVDNIKLWDLENCNLYKLKTELIIDGICHDEQIETFGFREVKLDTNKGFFLNGKHIKLNGVCEHHDLGLLGSAFNKVAQKRKIDILKEMGVNAIRTSHNMPAKEFMELADECGILVVSEAFDMWERKKTEYDYARFFNEWAEKDVASWVRRDRNHPSLIMWSIGNEINDTHVSIRGEEITKVLYNFVKEHDPNCNGAVTIGSNYMPWENAQKCADIVKIAGYNYSEKYYKEHHKQYPDWVIYGSETSSIVQSRGIYHFPYEKDLLSDDDEQCSSLGNSKTSWGAKSVEECMIYDSECEFSLGQFLWTGSDYIGEPTPYHTKNSYFGQIDTAGFKKDSFYMYQSFWTDYKTNPMIHILPYWDFNEGQLIDVIVCTNAPLMELFFNDISLGKFAPNKATRKLFGNWKIHFEKGELKALAYDENNNVIATDVKKSFSEPTEIVLTADKNILKANGCDLIFVEINVIDKDGIVVENAVNYVDVEVKGAGVLVGLDNGDSTDYDDYKGDRRRLFSGKLLAVIGATFEVGDLELVVTGKDLKPCSLTFTAVKSNIEIGSSKFLPNKKYPKPELTPVRKIQLFSDSKKVLTKETPTVDVVANILPANVVDITLCWDIVNSSGIKTNVATIEVNDNKAIITGISDGDFVLRCVAKDKLGKISTISQLEYKVEGLGETFLNPYEFVSAGLYTSSIGEVGNGNEKGIATSRHGETIVSYSKLNFGEYGSDKITLPIFALNDEAYNIEIWEGIAHEDNSQQLANVVYKKTSIWNVYQDDTYILSKRLTGLKTISFLLRDKVHIKGFTFEKIHKSFAKIYADENSMIYGDSFNQSESPCHDNHFIIEEIGNNVTLEFDNMLFDNISNCSLTICGLTTIDKNPIQILFDNGNDIVRENFDFLYSEDYVQQEFLVKSNLKDVKKISFVFLPGSKFNFKWFKFTQ